VDGIAVGIAGQLTREWAIFANATFLQSEVLQGYSDACIATPSEACGNVLGGVVIPDPIAGRPISGTPERAGNVWTTYDLDQWTFGYGIGYQSSYEYYTGTTLVQLAGSAGTVKGFTTHRAMVAFDVTRQLSLQLNANNLFNKVYYTRVRNNGWATPGDERSLVLSATYQF
jgi:catecholate siderophore receptor